MTQCICYKYPNSHWRVHLLYDIVSASARRQYELLKRQTKQELKHTLDSLLEGSEGVSSLIYIFPEYFNILSIFKTFIILKFEQMDLSSL